MTLYIIRHGETELNKQKRLQGQTDIPLNDYGRHLAKVTGQALADVRFDRVISSPLSRAMETARLVTGGREVVLTTDPRLQEISFGVYEGYCYGKEGYNVPDEGFINFFRTPEVFQAPPKGESIRDVLARTGAFWQELKNTPEYEGETILISTHGCTLKALLANIKQTDIKDFWGGGVHENCAVTKVQVTDGKAEVLEEGRIYY
jgi:probable phosphoglycerate mutase